MEHNGVIARITYWSVY